MSTRDRLRRDFDELAAIGATPTAACGGRRSATPISRRAPGSSSGRTAAGLETRVDAAGNHSAVLPAASAGARTLLIGSHLDTVPTGGRYDGALGVVAALEVLRAVKDAGLELPVSLEAIDFTDEEGSLVGLLGSWALAGDPDAGDPARATRRARRAGERARAGRADRARPGAGAARPGDARRVSRAAHRAGPGARARARRHRGRHRDRRVALVPAQLRRRAPPCRHDADGRPQGRARSARRAWCVAVEQTVVRDFPGCVATVGDIAIEPGAFNVVPGRARLALEFRSPDAAGARRARGGAARRRQRARRAPRGSRSSVEPVGRWEPTSSTARCAARSPRQLAPSACARSSWPQAPVTTPRRSPP